MVDADDLPKVKSGSLETKPTTPLHANPAVQEAIRYYTDPLLPTFGKKTASAQEAGVSPKVLDRKESQEEIERIQEERRDAGRDVAGFMAMYTWDAARELIDQLSVGRELDLMDPEELLDEKKAVNSFIKRFDALKNDMGEEEAEKLAKQVLRGRTSRAKEMIRHNKTVLEAARERRAALELLIRYHLGSPEQRMRVTRTPDGPEHKEMSELSDEELSQIGEAIQEEVKTREPREAVPEAEVVEIDDE